MTPIRLPEFLLKLMRFLHQVCAKSVTNECLMVERVDKGSAACRNSVSEQYANGLVSRTINTHCTVRRTERGARP